MSRKYSNDIEDKPIQTDREKVDEIYEAVMNANEVVDRPITFTYLGTQNTIIIYRKAPYEDCMCYLNLKDAYTQFSEMLKTIQAWQSEKLEQNIEEIYREEHRNEI